MLGTNRKENAQNKRVCSAGGGSYPAYHVDGQCVEQCDCGPTNPCAEYIFDHRGGEVEGRTFRDWWINEYFLRFNIEFAKPLKRRMT
eukprot:COSAG06_NODE_16279_length_1009_cov_1.040659_1_plen_86_part_01